MEGSKKTHTKFKNCIRCCVCFVAVVVGIISFANACSNRVSVAVAIENNVSAEANSGGNHVEGLGEIKTGPASAESSVETNVSGDEKTKVEVKAEAEANGKKAEIEVKEKNLKENVSIRRGVQGEGSEAKVNVDIVQNENDAENLNEETGEESNIDSGQSIGEEKSENFFVSIGEGISNAVKGIFNRIVSFFG